MTLYVHIFSLYPSTAAQLYTHKIWGIQPLLSIYFLHLRIVDIHEAKFVNNQHIKNLRGVLFDNLSIDEADLLGFVVPFLSTKPTHN